MVDINLHTSNLYQQTAPAPLPKEGKLTIFFSYAPYTGKTYAMLREAHKAKDNSVDVIVGHIREKTPIETKELLDGLERLAPFIGADGSAQEFDLDAALVRKPELILVDGLAHTNIAGCRHTKRCQDIEELLRAGIDVYTTVDVQFLESLNDLVSSITGVVEAERVPDPFFDAADRIEFVDIEPKKLIARLQDNKFSSQMQSELDFGNLVTLREIALRRIAPHSNQNIQKATCQEAREHILVCISSSATNAKIIRAASRLVNTFRDRFTAIHVETRESGRWLAEKRQRLYENIKLAEQLGAHVATVYGDDVAVQIAEYAKASGVTRVVLGGTGARKVFSKPSRNYPARLTQLLPDIDVYIIPRNQMVFREKTKKKGIPISLSWKDCGITVLLLFISSSISWLFDIMGSNEANIITIYILGVLFTSIGTNSRIYGVFASFASVIMFNFLFIVPKFTFFAYDPGYSVTFLVMLAASFLTSSLTMRVKSQARQAARKAYRTEVLLETSQKLQKTESAQEIIDAAGEQLVKLLNRPVLFYTIGTDKNLFTPCVYPAQQPQSMSEYLKPEEKAVAEWVRKNNRPAGATTETLPDAQCLYLAACGQSGVLAVVGIVMNGLPRIDSFESNLLYAMLDECGLTLEKEYLTREKQQVELTAQQESLRANLLRAISHDLRTPLTSIAGNAGILMENSATLDNVKKMELYTTIYDDTIWLISLVENLLSVTRMENGTMHLQMKLELLEDIFLEALNHLDRKASEHQLSIDLPEDMLMVKVDVQLILQVIVNIVNNAIIYTPAGSEIKLSAEQKGNYAIVKISDNGPGISEDAKPHIFDIFYTADNTRGDGRRALGLGLSLCKSIVNAHGGTICVKDSKPHGSTFCFTLPVSEVSCYE